MKDDKPETYWNYRLCKTEDNQYEEEVWDDHSIREVHYRGKEIIGYSEKPADVSGYMSAKDLESNLKLMLRACKKPVVDLDELAGKEVPNELF